MKTCAARSRGTVYAYAEAKRDGTAFRKVDDVTIFDGAKLRLQIKQSRDGTDPVVIERDFTAIEDRLEDSTSSGNYNGQAKQAGPHLFKTREELRPLGRRSAVKRGGAGPPRRQRPGGPSNGPPAGERGPQHLPRCRQGAAVRGRRHRRHRSVSR